MTARKDKDKKGRKKRVIGFQVIEEECIWMKAGVVNFRLCDNAYDCYNCPFDTGMRKAMSFQNSTELGEKKPGWVENLVKGYRGASRPCRHTLTGRINAPKVCSLNYECYHCAYDQMLDELDLVQPANAPTYSAVSGYRMADGYYYHMGHCWTRFEHGGRVRVGFDDFMVKLFGPAQKVSLPPLGASLRQGQVGWTFGRNNRKAAVLSPATGTVLALNQKAQEHPEITHEDPYQHGWLFMLEPDLPKKDLKRLYFGKEGFEWIEQEVKKLLNLMGPQYQQIAATGGEPVSDIFGSFPDIGWDRLARTFLFTEKLVTV